MTRPKTIGLTGNIGTGKSTVLRYLAKRGATVIDADALAHQAIAPGGPAYQAVIDHFGTDILLPDSSIDRKALGAIVFSDPSKLAQLEAIVHPAVFELAQRTLSETAAPLVVIEAIKLLESGRLLKLCDEVWVVTADEASQLRRLMQGRGMGEAEARQRMAAQSPQEEKVKRATRVIDNSSSIEQLYKQLDRLWSEVVNSTVVSDASEGQKI